MTDSTFTIGMVLFERFTQLDLTGPHEILARIPGARVVLVARNLAPVTADCGLSVVPTATIADCPPLDMIFVPGGPGQLALMDDEDMLAFLRRSADGARYVTSVCTGSLVLAAAGLLRGYRAACHWLSRDQLALMGAVPVAERVVIDRNRITGAGVTSGIDFAFVVAAELCGRQTAEEIQLAVEYDPAPPFDSGSPERAAPALVAGIRERSSAWQAKREAAARKAGALLSGGSLSEARGPKA